MKYDLNDLSFSDAPNIKVTPPGPQSQEFIEFQKAHEGNLVSYARSMPMAVKCAKGATIEDMDGNRYVDLFGGAAVMAAGHSNPDVVAAVQEALTQQTHMLDFPNPYRMRLVERLTKRLPQELSRLSFGGPTGSDAVEMAVKLARFNTKRYPILAFEGAYHGMTSAALTLCSGKSYKEDFLPLIPEVHFAPYAYCYRCVFKKERGSCGIECADYVEHLFDDPHSGVAKPAAIIIEPIQGEGGSVVPPPEYMQKLRASCTKHDVLLIADEIQSGLGRTGKMFAFQHSGIVPDIVTMSKALGGIGLPISGIAYREELNTWTPGKHIGTFRGNVMAYAAGAAAMDFFDENDILAHTNQLGEEMLSWLKELETSTKIVGESRGQGLMIGVEIVKDQATKEPSPEMARELRSYCHKNGVMIEIGGHYNNVARLLPPLVLTRDLAKRGCDVLASGIRELEKNIH